VNFAALLVGSWLCRDSVRLLDCRTVFVSFYVPFTACFSVLLSYMYSVHGVS